MTLSSSDIENLEHDLIALAKKTVIYGKTTGGVFVPFRVDADGKLEIV